MFNIASYMQRAVINIYTGRLSSNLYKYSGTNRSAKSKKEFQLGTKKVGINFLTRTASPLLFGLYNILCSCMHLMHIIIAVLCNCLDAAVTYTDHTNIKQYRSTCVLIRNALDTTLHVYSCTHKAPP